MNRIIIVRVNSQLITKKKIKDKLVAYFDSKFSKDEVIYDFCINKEVFNGFIFKIEVV